MSLGRAIVKGWAEGSARSDILGTVARGRRSDGSWYITSLYWQPWWRLDVPVRTVLAMRKANP